MLRSEQDKMLKKERMQPDSQPSIKQLFTLFLRLGITAFGGPSMIAYIRKMAVEEKKWLDSETFSSGVALCQIIPGATAMQVAAYVGLKTRGVIGAGASFIGFALPAFMLMMTFAVLYSSNHNLPIVVSTFSGLQAVIVAVIANAALSFGKVILKDWKTLVIAAIAAAMFGMSVNPVIVILISVVAGLAIIKPLGQSTVTVIKSDEKSGLIINNAAIINRDSNSVIPQKHLSYRKLLLLIFSVVAVAFLLLFIFDRNLFNIALLMFRIDLFAFGGGFASIPLMLHEIVEVRNWVDNQTFMNGIVLGQVTPGPIVITATFVGYLAGGLIGAVVATIGIFSPSFLILLALSPYFDRLKSSQVFNRAINGVLCSFVGLLITVTIRFTLNVQWDLSHLFLAFTAFTALYMKADILWVVLIGTILSIVMLG